MNLQQLEALIETHKTVTDRFRWRNKFKDAGCDVKIIDTMNGAVYGERGADLYGSAVAAAKTSDGWYAFPIAGDCHGNNILALFDFKGAPRENKGYVACAKMEMLHDGGLKKVEKGIISDQPIQRATSLRVAIEI